MNIVKFLKNTYLEEHLLTIASEINSLFFIFFSSSEIIISVSNAKLERLFSKLKFVKINFCCSLSG